MTNENSLKINSDVTSVVQEISSVMDAARNHAMREVNNELLRAYWNIGRIICEYEQSLPDRADYGKQTLLTLSKALTKELGKGFSRSNLQHMRQFYLAYPICQTLSGKLSWANDWSGKDCPRADKKSEPVSRLVFTSNVRSCSRGRNHSV